MLEIKQWILSGLSPALNFVKNGKPKNLAVLYTYVSSESPSSQAMAQVVEG